MKKPNKKLIKETKALIRLRLFLNECGLLKYRFSASMLKEILGMVKKTT